jgi:hypothetical protein
MNVWANDPNMKFKLKMVVVASEAKFHQITLVSDR